MTTKTKQPRVSKGLGSFARLHDFVQRKKNEKLVDYAQVFERVLGHVKQHVNKGTITFRVEDQESIYLLNLNEGVVRKGSADTKSDFHVIIKAEALENIFSGKNSPIISMAKGELAVQGDLELGKSLYKSLAADEGKIDPCN